jgi:metal-sulfur cluster biosynthetic enzyme
MPDELETDAAVRGCLDEIADPCSMASASPMGLAEMGLVKAVTVSADGDVRIDLRLTSPTCNMLGFMAEEATRRVRELPGVRSVEVVADEGMDWAPSMIAPAAQERRRERLTLMAQSRGRRSPRAHTA